MRLTLLCVLVAQAVLPRAVPGETEPPKYRLVAVGRQEPEFGESKILMLMDVNDSAMVCGWGSVSAEEEAVRPFLFADGKIVLPPLPDAGSKGATCRRLNRAGHMVGEFWIERNFPKPFLYKNGRITRLDTGDDPCGSASDINMSGVIAGCTGALFRSNRRAAIWRDGKLLELGELEGEREAYATGINDQGKVVGVSGKTSWIWQEERLNKLGSGPEYEWLFMNEIGDDGWVVGYTKPVGGFQAAVKWKDGVLHALPALSKLKSHDNAFAVNRQGWIVGHSRAASGDVVASLWIGDRVYDLNELTVGGDAGILLQAGHGINNNGLICGVGTQDRKMIAVILIPENSLSQ